MYRPDLLTFIRLLTQTMSSLQTREDALYEIASMRQLFKTVNQWLSDCGVMMTQGTLMDATIIEAPSSTKNKKNERDPDMHQTKKGNEWHFGMKAHIGVDAKSGLTHTLVTTAANQHDLNQLHNLLHGDEEFISGVKQPELLSY